jgi:hypothetical protein
MTMQEFRNTQQMQHDEQLVGTWWRCPSHGITDGPILLSSVAYCPEDECPSQVKLVHSSINDPDANAQARSVWRKSSDLFLATGPAGGASKKKK